MTILDDQPAPRPSGGQSLGRKTARGVMWMTLQGFGVKGATTVSSFILMALLDEEHWGLYALAASMRALLDVTGRVGMRQVLVHRQKHFRRWATPAFWMCMAIGLLSAILLMSAAPLMVMKYDQPDLYGLMGLLAISAPFLASGMVPQAKLMSQMRFKAIAGIELVAHLATIIATVVLAFAGAKAYSFFLPLPFLQLGRSACFWYLARPKIRMTPQIRRWKFLFGDSSSLFVSSILQRVVSQADYLIIGLFHPAAIVGIYAVAFRLSTQSVGLTAGNLTQAMLPALSKMQDDVKRQMKAFVRAGTLLTAMFTPIGFAQAALCEPLLRLIFVDKWHESIPVIQIMSMFIVVRVMSGPALSLLRAQGRFKFDMAIQFVSTVLFLILVPIAAAFWSINAVALTVCLISVFIVPLRVYCGIKPADGTWIDVLEMYRRPISVGLVAFGTAYSSQWLIPDDLPHAVRYSSELVITFLLGFGLYAALLRLFTPELWNELVQQLHQVNPLQRFLSKR